MNVPPQLDLFGAGRPSAGEAVAICDGALAGSCDGDAADVDAQKVGEVDDADDLDADFDEEEFDEEADGDPEDAERVERPALACQDAIHDKATLLETLAKRVAIDAADPDLMPTLLARLRTFEPAATITLATVERLGVRGLVACLLASEDESACGYWHLAEYAKAKDGLPVERLFTLAVDVVSCPTCGVFETHHDTPRHSRESDEPTRPFPCDPGVYAAARAAEIAATKARYAIGARIGGYASFAWPDPERFVVTRSILGVKPPSWWKGSMSVNWDRPLPWYDSAVLARLYQGPRFETNPERIWFEFNAADAVAPTLF